MAIYLRNNITVSGVLVSNVNNVISPLVLVPEVVDTVDIPYLPKTGQDYEDLTNPVNTSGTLGESYSGYPAENNDQWVHDTQTTNESIPFDIDTQGYWILDGTLTNEDTVSFYRIDSSGDVDVIDTITFTPFTNNFLNETLDAFTLVSSGDVELIGDLLEQLGNITTVSTGSLLNILELSKTLDNVVSTASGDIVLTGSITSTLEDINMFSDTINAATLNYTLEDLTGTLSGDALLQGSLTETLSNFTSIFYTDQSINSSANIDLEQFNLISSGQVTTTAILSETIDGITMLSGEITYGGSDNTLEDFTVVLDSSIENIATLLESSDDVLSSTVATVSLEGNLDETLEDVISVAAINVVTNGSLSEVLEDITMGTSSLPERLYKIKYIVHILKNQFGG